MLQLLQRVSREPWFTIAAATVLLFVFSAVVAPTSTTPNALQSIMPYVAIVCVASLGQMLAFLQRGIDLSVAGTISLTGVFLTKIPANDNRLLVWGLVLTFASALIAGTVNGWLIAYVRVNPLVATLGVGTILEGVVRIVSGGKAFGATPPALAEFGAAKILGVSSLLWLALVVTALLWVFLAHYSPGRWLSASGANPRATRALGTRQELIVVASYIMSSLLFALAGVMMTAFFVTPGLTQGTGYMLPTIAVAVVGGTAVAGGVATVWGTFLGALFLQQLSVAAFILTKGETQSTTAVQFIVSGAVIAAGMAFKGVEFGRLGGLLGGRSPGAASTPSVGSADAHGS